MKNIDLTTKTAALDYLRSLDPETKIDLPGYHEASTAASDAVAVITDESPNAWATSKGKWEWTAADLAEAVLIGRTVTLSETGASAEILQVFPDGDVYLRFEDRDEGSYSLNEVEL
jgi:hypothetical protein